MRVGHFIVGVVALLAVALGGCDKHSLEKQAINATWDKLAAAQTGAQQADLLSKSTIDYYTRVIKNALDSPAKDVLSYPPNDQRIILRIRHRCKRSELRTINGRGLVILEAERGWDGENAIDPEEWSLTNIRVAEDANGVATGRATAEIYNPDWEAEYRSSSFARSLSRSSRRLTQAVEKPPRYPIDFVNEGGEWKIDEIAAFTQVDKEITDTAKKLKMSVKDFLERLEEDQSGEPVPKDIWGPMKK
jgi:hypothetical protein